MRPNISKSDFDYIEKKLEDGYTLEDVVNIIPDAVAATPEDEEPYKEGEKIYQLYFENGKFGGYDLTYRVPKIHPQAVFMYNVRHTSTWNVYVIYGRNKRKVLETYVKYLRDKVDFARKQIDELDSYIYDTEDVINDINYKIINGLEE